MSNTGHNSDWPAWATEPVRIVRPDPSWPAKALSLIKELLTRLAPFDVSSIEHIGSTAIHDLPAKPIIDLLAEVSSFDNMEHIARTLRPDDWHFVPPDLDQRPERRFFIKVELDKRAAHLHFMLPDTTGGKAEIRFRDLLARNPGLKEQYAALKMELAQQYNTDREAYTLSKSDFIKKALSNDMQRIRIIFATNNAHKVEEIQSAIGHSLEVISLRQAGIDIDIPEPHDTLEANATEKSTTIYRLTGDNCFSEDTGLEVAALNGEPGVKSARYAGEDRTFEKNVEKVLTRLAAANTAANTAANPSGAVPGRNTPSRNARFRTVISLLWNGEEHLFEGICEGHILEKPTGKEGFGYDPIFVPNGDTRSFAQMSMEEKNRYSHRRKAADQLVSFLQNNTAHTSSIPND